MRENGIPPTRKSRRPGWKGKEHLFLREMYDARELYEIPMHALYLDDSVEAARLVEQTFPALRTPIMSEITGGADVIPAHLSKAYGLELLLEHWGIRREESAAIGDSMNDFEMIQAAGIGIAMGNGIPALKEAADYVTSDISEDGLKNAFHYLGRYRNPGCYRKRRKKIKGGL